MLFFFSEPSGNQRRYNHNNTPVRCFSCPLWTVYGTSAHPPKATPRRSSQQTSKNNKCPTARNPLPLPCPPLSLPSASHLRGRFWHLLSHLLQTHRAPAQDLTAATTSSSSCLLSPIQASVHQSIPLSPFLGIFFAPLDSRVRCSLSSPPRKPWLRLCPSKAASLSGPLQPAPQPSANTSRNGDGNQAGELEESDHCITHLLSASATLRFLITAASLLRFLLFPTLFFSAEPAIAEARSRRQLRSFYTTKT